VMAADSSSGNMSGSNAFSYDFGNSVTIDNNSEETPTFGVEQLQHLFREQQRFLDYFFKNLNYEQVCCHLLLLLLSTGLSNCCESSVCNADRSSDHLLFSDVEMLFALTVRRSRS